MADNYIDVTLSEIFGTGVASVEQTETSAEPGGYNVWTITLTNGHTSTFTVRNGTAGGSPMPVLNSVDMTDTTGIYLYLGNEEGYVTGHWYCYANDAWTDFGAYSEKGDPGLAPTVEISKTGGTTTITITDAEGEHVATIEDGISPTVKVANTAADMTDTSLIYVYAGSETAYNNGDWYIYDSYIGQWRSGGTYQASVPRIDQTLTIPGAAADSAKVGQEISDLKSQIAQSTGMSTDFKVALENLLSHVGFSGDDPTGRTYLEALHTAMYPPANLTRIEAVYTQSGDVYDTDTLDSLRDDLVVTAYYDNATSEVISSYTLSGTLVEGTSTITVSYGGKTTTFTVTVLTGFVYTPAKGLLSAQSGVTGTNLSAFTESIVDDALRLYSPKVSTESTGSFTFDDVTFTNSLYVKLVFKAVTIASISASNTGHWGSPNLVFGNGTGQSLIGFGTTPNVADRIRYFNGSTMSYIPITLNEWHTVELLVENGKQTFTLDGTVVVNSANPYSSTTTARRLSVANSKNTAIDFYIQRLELKGE